MKNKKLSKKVSRRQVVQGAASAAALAAVGCSLSPKKSSDREPAGFGLGSKREYDFIIVGAGPGGGPLACRLAQAGFTVLLLEAGSMNSGQNSPVPVMHGKATEDSQINWSFFTQRHTNQTTEQLNSKYTPGKGVYYPRGTGVGGSASMNAMLALYPDHQDWEAIRKLTKDDSWNAADMFYHFERLQTRLPDRPKGWEFLREASQRGWLELNQNSISFLLQDAQLLNIVIAALKFEGLTTEVLQKLYAENYNLKLNPNTVAYLSHKLDGLYNIPVTQKNGYRTGVRDFVAETMEKYPNNLFVSTLSLAKTLITDENDKSKIIGVEFAVGGELYSAHRKHDPARTGYRTEKAFAIKEVILSGGVFNTPQLLQLSGIGDENWLRQKGIEPKVHLPAVGSNLQDRYEISVVNQFPQGFSLLEGCDFNNLQDACGAKFTADPLDSPYSTNGVSISLIKRSYEGRATPDLCLFGIPGYFRGYYPMWSDHSYNNKFFSWVILKGHSKNKSGYVRIRSNDFRDTPEIHFKAFGDGANLYGEDMNAMLAGIKMARGINKNISKDLSPAEVLPGPGISSDARLRSFVNEESWGHHASCTSPMGPIGDPKAVVDSQFRVQKTKGLRIVDASVFPDIPGLFIMVPILTISEKAAQMLIEQYKKKS